MDTDEAVTLHYIEPTVAEQMDGEGPDNKWAYGQGSTSREIVVYWIYKNAFRGQSYAARIPEWIDNIVSCEVSCTSIRDVLNRTTDGRPRLLVVDVQGAELSVLSGLSADQLPHWIFVETDLGDTGVHSLLRQMGYQREVEGSDSCYSRRGYEVLISGADA